MASRTLSFKQWFRLVTGQALADGFANVAGHPPADVARKLDVTRERVSQLIREGTLDTLEITTAAGKVALTLVTDASLERYLATRVPDRNRQGYFAFPS
jgi:plasmid maintenance system antidote protein VapI